MPAISPRRECPCRSNPPLVEHFQEEALGHAPFAWLAGGGAVLGIVQVLAAVRGWGWMVWGVLLGLDVLWLLVLASLILERRSQARDGLGHVRLDDAALRLGGELGLHIGSSRGLSGLRGIEVSLRCVDAFMEEREVAGQEGPTKEMMQVCYVVWEDRREVRGPDLPARGEASVRFDLPSQSDFAGPWGTWVERCWEIEVVRLGGAATLRFRVLVSS